MCGKYSPTQKEVTTLQKNAICVACYAIPVAQVTFLVARDALKTVGIMPKFLYEFNDLLQGVIKHLIRVLNRILYCHCCATYRPNT